MLLCCQRFCADNCVSVVCCATYNCIGLIQQFGIHLLVVVVYFHVGEELLVFVYDAFCILLVDVAHADEFDIVIYLVFSFECDAVDDSMTTATNTYCEDFDFASLCFFLCLGFTKHISRSHCQCSGCCCSCFEERSS